MRLLDAKSPHWAIRHIYVFMAIAGLLLVASMYPIVGYLSVRNQAILENMPFDSPNWVYYHDGGDAALAFFMLLGFGIGLLIISPMVAIGYMSIRQGMSPFKVKGSNIE
jgi:hypothetical protein